MDKRGFGKATTTQKAQPSPERVGGRPEAPRRPLLKSLVPETWLTPFSATAASAPTDTPKDSATPSNVGGTIKQVLGDVLKSRESSRFPCGQSLLGQCLHQDYSSTCTLANDRDLAPFCYLWARGECGGCYKRHYYLENDGEKVVFRRELNAYSQFVRTRATPPRTAMSLGIYT